MHSLDAVYVALLSSRFSVCYIITYDVSVCLFQVWLPRNFLKNQSCQFKSFQKYGTFHTSIIIMVMWKQLILFFFTAQCYASAVQAMALNLSLHPPVTSWHSIITAKYIITQTMPHSSPGTLVFLLPRIVVKFEWCRHHLCLHVNSHFPHKPWLIVVPSFLFLHFFWQRTFGINGVGFFRYRMLLLSPTVSQPCTKYRVLVRP